MNTSTLYFALFGHHWQWNKIDCNLLVSQLLNKNEMYAYENNIIMLISKQF